MKCEIFYFYLRIGYNATQEQLDLFRNQVRKHFIIIFKIKIFSQYGPEI